MNKLTEEEKGKARVIATMCGGVIPAWAMPNNDDREENDDEPNTSKREQN